MKKSAILCTWLIALVCSACATTPQPAADVAPGQLEPGIYATKTGKKLTPEALFEALAKHPFVAVGEKHDDPWSHKVQARVFRGLIGEHDALALGMEMFQRPFQAPLDAYIAGDIGEAEMLAQTEWATRWGFGAEFYRPLWQLARESGAPIVALNARRELSKAIARGGLESLNEAERADVPELDLDNKAHRAFVRHAFEQHDMQMSEERFERFYTAQVLWDETMAETAVAFMREHPEIDTMLIVAGGAHADERFGIPPRIERRIDAEVVTVQPIAQETDGASEASSWEQLSQAADYVWVGK